MFNIGLNVGSLFNFKPMIIRRNVSQEIKEQVYNDRDSMFPSHLSDKRGEPVAECAYEDYECKGLVLECRKYYEQGQYNPRNSLEIVIDICCDKPCAGDKIIPLCGDYEGQEFDVKEVTSNGVTHTVMIRDN